MHLVGFFDNKVWQNTDNHSRGECKKKKKYNYHVGKLFNRSREIIIIVEDMLLRTKKSKWEANRNILERYQITPAACLWNMVTWSCKGAWGNASPYGSLCITCLASAKSRIWQSTTENWNTAHSTCRLWIFNISHFARSYFLIQLSISVIREPDGTDIKLSSRMLILTALFNKKMDHGITSPNRS